MVVPGSIPNMMRSFANLFALFCRMFSIPDKAKQFLIAVAKLLVVGAAFYFIYTQLAENDQLDWVKFEEKFHKNKTFSGIFLILLLSFLNRFFEILKWQNLVSSIKKISIGETSEQVLAAMTTAIFTPNGIGEYGAKALYFEKSEAKKIVFLNLVCNGIQMILTIVFGFFGLLYFNAAFGIITTKTVAIIFGVFILLIVVSFFLKKITIRGYSLEKALKKVGELPKEIHQKNIFLGICRYLIFSHQYYFLFRAFDVEVPYLILMSAICSVYFLASSLPTFQFLDFAVKGSVAVYFFGLLGVNEWITVFITMLMWFLNIVLPVILGSYFVIRFKPQWKS